MTHHLNRRSAIAALTGLGAAALIHPTPARAASPDRKRALRVAHITDCHLDGRPGSLEGVTRAFQHIHALPDPVDLIINTGDTVFCINEVDRNEADRQWKLWTDVLKAECRLPIMHAIGNHDCWSFTPPSPDNPMRGKGMVIDILNLPGRYYRRSISGWHLIALDSIMGGYVGRLDDEQFEWLKSELAAIPDNQPVCIVNHIPIVSASGYFLGDRFKNGHWDVPGSWMHEDAARLNNLFIQHPNVRVCLSGHMHQVDRIDFNGVSYLCGGAVSGNWWDGKYYQCDYGYETIDLYDDGSFERRYINYADPG